MSRQMSTAEYQALAEFRFLIRCYLNNTEKEARSVGLEPQQYQALLAVRGLPEGQRPTIRTLAERLQILHHSAVELVDRMQRRGLFRRERLKNDRRHVLVYMTPRGEKLLSRLVRHRLAELRISGPALALALSAVTAASDGGATNSATKGDVVTKVRRRVHKQSK
jgi:DNA-binding MarR family transcriptional regulator